MSTAKDAFETTLGITKPTCCSHGDCCKGASPSKPAQQLLARAAAGDVFARGFFSIMIPYTSLESARAVVPGLVERTLAAAKKQPDAFPNPETDVVFYHCRYLQADNRCGVYEDRPQFCRDYPDTPYVVFAPGCAFEPWAQTCRTTHQRLKDETQKLANITQNLQHSNSSHTDASNTLLEAELTLSALSPQHYAIESYALLLSLTPLNKNPLYLSSPFLSILF